MSFISLQAKLMIDEKREADNYRAHARAKRMPKRNYTNFSGNYGGPGDEAWKKYFEHIEKFRNMSAW